MSNQNINISASNVKGKCELKCSYAFKYTESNSTAKNNGVLIDLTYDSTNVPPVVYNTEKYIVENITIVSPSIHTFNDKSMPGEIIITHNPQNGGNSLKVCIPFTSSIESSTSSQLSQSPIYNQLHHHDDHHHDQLILDSNNQLKDNS